MAIKRLNVASEDTLQGVKTDVAGVKVDVASVNSNIGGTADTGGSSSEGTSMAKLNYLIESLKTVLNSTTGTAGLKTLDKIIEEKLSTLKKYVSSSSLIKSDSYSGKTFNATGSNYQQTKILDFYVEHNGVVKITVNTTNETGIASGNRYGYYKVVVGSPDDPIYESSEINGDVDFTTNVPVVAYKNYNIFMLSRAKVSSDVDIGCTSASVKVYGTLS